MHDGISGDHPGIRSWDGCRLLSCEAPDIVYRCLTIAPDFGDLRRDHRVDVKTSADKKCTAARRTRGEN
jgi:hypothetical protein